MIQDSYAHHMTSHADIKHKSNGDTKNKSKYGASTSRSNILEAEEHVAETESSEVKNASSQKCYKEGGRDMVMIRLGKKNQDNERKFSRCRLELVWY